MPANVIKPTYAAQNSSARSQSRKWVVEGTETRGKKMIDKHAQKVYNYIYTKWQAETPWPPGSRSCAGSCVGSLSTASRIAFRRVVLSTRQLLGGLKSCRTCGIRLVKASFYATVLHSSCKR